MIIILSQPVGKKLAVVEVCVGRQVDRVRSGDEDGEGDNNNMMTRDTISHQEHKSEQYGNKH